MADENNIITLPSDGYERDGYTLVGWSIDGTQYSLGAQYKITRNTTAYAVWHQDGKANTGIIPLVSCDVNTTTDGNNVKTGKIAVVKPTKFPYSYKYGTSGTKKVYVSNNVSSFVFTGTSSNSLKRQLNDLKLNDNVCVLSTYSVADTVYISSVTVGSSLTSIRDNAMAGCSNIRQFEIPAKIKVVSKYAFASCSRLKTLTFENYDRDGDDLNATHMLTSFGDCMLSGSNSVKSVTMPASVNSTSKISQTALAGSSIDELTLLGFNNSAVAQLTASHCLGLNRDCAVYSGEKRKYLYRQQSNTIVEQQDWNVFSGTKIKTGRKDKLLFGKRAYFYTEELFKWCIDPSTQDRSKFAGRECPCVVIYGDFTTSAKTKAFLHGILENENLYKWMKESFRAYMFVLDRGGKISNSEAGSDVQYFRRYAGGYEKEFVSVNFYYAGKSNSVAFTGSLEEFEALLLEYSSKTGFWNFNAEGYESVLDEPDPETIPSTGLDANSFKTYHGNSFPEWYSSGMKTPTAWNLDSTPFDFDNVSTPDTTYVLVGGYDERNPNDYPKACRDMLGYFSPYSDHVFETWNTECKGGRYKSLFKNGTKYRFFIFYEFSHGNHQLITVGISYSEIWNVFKDAGTHNRIYGMFDSCDSGSMLQGRLRADSDTDDKPGITVLTYIKQKFERRTQLMSSMFKASTRTVDPKMILWSSTADYHYGWYQPTSNTTFVSGFETGYNKAKSGGVYPRFRTLWPKVKDAGSSKIGQGEDECIPQKMCYPNDNNSFELNKTFM